LRARYLVHGDIIDESQDTYLIQIRVLQPAAVPVSHWDFHTRDQTPAYTWRGYYNNLLTPSKGVVDAATAPMYVSELESVARGIAGQLAASTGDHKLARTMLERALDSAGSSRSSQIDLLRADLARLMADQGDWADALALMRGRLTDSELAAPEMLRSYQHIGFKVINSPRIEVDQITQDRIENECLAALRKAVQQDNDPLYDLSLYNLVLALRRKSFEAGPSGRLYAEESERLLAELMSSSPVYRHLWYVKVLRGSLSWWKSEEACANGEVDACRRLAADAAKWYGRGLAARNPVHGDQSCWSCGALPYLSNASRSCGESS
jgi:hypothetical protein